MRGKTNSDSKLKQKKPKQCSARSNSVNLPNEPETTDMQLLLSENRTDSPVSDNIIETNLKSMQSGKEANTSTETSSTVEKSRLSPAMKEDVVHCDADECEKEKTPDHITGTRPTSVTSVNSSRTSRGSDYFSSSSSADTHNETTSPLPNEGIEDSRETIGVDDTTTPSTGNPKLDSSRKEEEEEGFVDGENFSPVNDKHFNNSSNIRERSFKSLKSPSQRHGVSTKDINKKLSEVDHLNPISSMAMIADPQLTYVDRVILELLDTERMYVRALEDILAGYFLAIKNTSLPVTSEDIEKLFLNIREIYQFNRKFLAFLENCESDPVLIAEHFLSQDGSFSVYTDYCTNYPVAVGILTRWMKIPILADFLKNQQESLRHTLPLGPYLLKPVQRILKYHLILQEMVKNCNEDVENYWVIEEALYTMTHIARHINEMKRKHEDAVHIQEIQSLLTNWQGNDLTTYGELVMEGELKLQGAKNERLVFLFDKMILVTKRREDSFLVCKITIMCSDLILLESVKENPLSFLISPFDNPSFANNSHNSRTSKQFIFTAKYPEDKKLWTQTIKRLIIKNHHAAIPLHAQQSIMNADTIEDGTEQRYHKKQRYSNASVDDFKKPSLKRFGTSVSASSLGKGLIRRRSDSGSRKSVQARNKQADLRRKQEVEQSGDVSSDSVASTPSVASPGKGRFSFSKITSPVTPKREVDQKQQQEMERKEPDVQEIEIIEEAGSTGDDSVHSVSDRDNAEEKNTKETSNAKKSEKYKKSTIYRRHKRRKNKETSGEDSEKNNLFPTEVKRKNDTTSLDMPLDDFETAEDFLSFNIDNTRDSVSWDVQIVEAAFERFKQEKAQAEEQLRAASADAAPLIPMPNRQRYVSYTDSSGDESEQKSNQLPSITSSTGKETQNRSDASAKITALERKETIIEHINKPTDNDKNSHIFTKSQLNENYLEVENRDPTENKAKQVVVQNSTVDANNNEAQPKEPTARPLSLLERKKYFEKLKEIRDRRQSQLNLGSDAKTIQSGLVKGMIEQHAETMSSQAKLPGGVSPPVQKHNPLDHSHQAGDNTCSSSRQNNPVSKECNETVDYERERVELAQNAANAKPEQTPWYEKFPRNASQEVNGPSFGKFQLRKTNYQAIDVDHTDDKTRASQCAFLPSLDADNSNGDAKNEKKNETEARKPGKLKFKNFLQPQMLLWRSHPETTGFNVRKGKKILDKEQSTPASHNSPDVHVSSNPLEENRLPRSNSYKLRESPEAYKMSETANSFWSNLEKESKVYYSSSSSESLLDRRSSEIQAPASNEKKDCSTIQKTPSVKAPTATISLRGSPVSPTHGKTKIRQIRLASSADKHDETHTEPAADKPPISTTVTTPKGHNVFARRNSDSKMGSVMELAQQFDKASVSNPSKAILRNGRSRSVGARKHLSDLRFSAPGEKPTRDQVSYDEIKQQTKNSIIRRNSTSARFRPERSASPNPRTPEMVPRKAHLIRRTSDRVVYTPSDSNYRSVFNDFSRVSRALREKRLQQELEKREKSESIKSSCKSQERSACGPEKQHQSKPQKETKKTDVGSETAKQRNGDKDIPATAEVKTEKPDQSELEQRKDNQQPKPKEQQNEVNSRQECIDHKKNRQDKLIQSEEESKIKEKPDSQDKQTDQDKHDSVKLETPEPRTVQRAKSHHVSTYNLASQPLSTFNSFSIARTRSSNISTKRLQRHVQVDATLVKPNPLEKNSAPKKNALVVSDFVSAFCKV